MSHTISGSPTLCGVAGSPWHHVLPADWCSSRLPINQRVLTQSSRKSGVRIYCVAAPRDRDVPITCSLGQTVLASVFWPYDSYDLTQYFSNLKKNPQPSVRNTFYVARKPHKTTPLHAMYSCHCLFCFSFLKVMIMKPNLFSDLLLGCNLQNEKCM